MKRDPDDPKNLLRCPNCGLTIDFTAPFVKCEKCRKLLCKNCTWKYKDRRFCKDCQKSYATEMNRNRNRAPG